MRMIGLLAACAACSTSSEDKGPEGNESTADADPCDGQGDPAVQVGSVVDDAFAAWGPSVAYYAETDTNTDYALDVGIAVANLQLDGFATVHLVVTQAGDPKFEADVPVGVSCQPGVGLVGSTAIRWPWNTVDGQELLFEATITDDAGGSATGAATVLVTGG